jgi:hypothetical protein
MSTPIGDRLVLLLAHHARDPADDGWIARNVRRVEDWAEVARIAHDNRVAPRTYRELERMGLLDVVAGPVREALAAHAEQVRADNARRLARAVPIVGALRSRGIDVAVLKGVAFGRSLYGDPGYKRMNDVDLLVRPHQVHAVVRVFDELGLLRIADHTKHVDPARTHHLAPYVTRDLHCMLGVQWTFRPPVLGHDFDLDAVWSRTRPLQLGDAIVRMLAPEDNVHHVALHLERYKTGVRDVMDLYNLVHAHRASFDWGLLRAEVDRSGTHDDVYYGLALANAHRPTHEVEDLLIALRPRVRPAIVRLAAARTRSPEVLLRICSRQFAAIETAVSAFNATGVAREKAPRFVDGWAAFFWPSREDALKICAIVDPSPVDLVRARVVAPIRLLGAVADEIGAALLAGLAVKSCADLAWSLVPFRRKHDLEAYAARLGLTLAELTTLRAMVQ